MGVLVDEDTEQPVVGERLGLVIAEQTAGGVTLRFRGSDDPRAETDNSGLFRFEDVPPGKYTLVIFFGLGPPSVIGDDKGATILFEVMAGQVIDLGTVLVTE